MWFNGKAEEAANFYTAIFKHSKIVKPDALWRSGPGTKGTVMAVTFELAGREFTGTGDKEIQEIENPRKVPRIETARQSHKRALPNL